MKSWMNMIQQISILHQVLRMKITKDVANNRDMEDKMFNVNKVDLYSVNLEYFNFYKYQFKLLFLFKIITSLYFIFYIF